MNETMNHPGTDDQTQSQPGGPYPPRTALQRPRHGRMLAGVAAGLADYLGVDATLVRIVFAVLTVAGGAAVPIYLACWLLIPEEGSEQSIAGGWFQSHQL
jgi:phage shock protein PspC (stress-responsive transcriptional regulator)